jgi:hypothetical protein
MHGIGFEELHVFLEMVQKAAFFAYAEMAVYANYALYHRLIASVGRKTPPDALIYADLAAFHDFQRRVVLLFRHACAA